MLDMGMSLEDVLLKKTPVQVDVSVDTANLVTAIESSQKDAGDTLKAIQGVITDSNKFNKDLLVKALSLVIKEVNLAGQKPTDSSKPITGLKILRNKNSNLLENIKFIRD